jgi:probable F420-dependent oxidoreductase
MKFRVQMPGMSLYPGGQRHWFEDLTPDEMIRIAQAADELGFASLHVPEHIAMHVDDVEMMSARWVHVMTAMAFFASVTKRIKVAGLIVVPYHHPVELAKSISTLDFLSGGRVLMMGAVGYMQWEYELMGAPPFAERGAVMDEYLEAMIELWTKDRPEYHGRYVDFKDIVFEPKPVRQPHPTLWLAGNSRAALRRAGRLADGWHPNAISRTRLREQLAYLHDQPEFAARERPFDVFLNLFEREMDLTTHQVSRAPRVIVEPEAVLDQIGQLSELGVTVTDVDSVIGGGTGARETVGANPVRSCDEFIERLQWFAAEIMPRAQAL